MLLMLEVREELGEEVTKGLLAMEMEMRAYLAPSTRSREEIQKDAIQCGGLTVSRVPNVQGAVGGICGLHHMPRLRKEGGGRR